MADSSISISSESSKTKNDEKLVYFDLNLTNFPKLIRTEEITIMNELDIDSAREKLAHILSLNCDMETADAIVTDYYFWNYWWAKCHLIHTNKIDAMLTLSLFLLNNLRDHKLDQDENLKQLKKVLLSTPVEVADKNPLMFTMDDLKQMLDYFGINFFQHYRLYECCFRRHRKELVIHHTMTFETIEDNMEPFPPPLMTAMSEATFKNQIDPNYPPVYVASHPNIEENLSFFMQNIHGN